MAHGLNLDGILPSSPPAVRSESAPARGRLAGERCSRDSVEPTLHGLWVLRALGLVAYAEVSEEFECLDVS